MQRLAMANTIVKCLFLNCLFHKTIKYKIIFDGIVISKQN